MRPLIAALLLVAACGTTYQVPPVASGSIPPPPAAGGPDRRTSVDFRRVASRVEPQAETFCREDHPDTQPIFCDFAIRLETDPRMPPNAFQTLSQRGRPVIVFSQSLLDQMTDDDEIAFVLSHEASHHIAEHLAKQRQQSLLGALVVGGIVAAGGGYDGAGASDAQIRQAMDLGAFVGGRAYSQTYELEADTLGAFIAARAGYDPERGAAIFASPALAGGGELLSTHPASQQRLATIAAVAADIRRQQAAGLYPAP